MRPVPEVFDLFAVPDAAHPLSGGRGHSVVAGDLALSPDRDPRMAAWLYPVLAPLAGRLDAQRPRSLRIAMPIPARNGEWVVHGWGATRFEEHATPCSDLATLRATGHLLHALFASLTPTPGPAMNIRQDRWGRAAAMVFGEAPLPTTGATAALVESLAALDAGLGRSGPVDLGPDQVVHSDLAGNVLLDATGIPLVIDVSPMWRPALWAEAVLVLDAVMWHGAPESAMDEWRTGRAGRAMARAGLFRVLSDATGPGCTDVEGQVAVERYRDVLGLSSVQPRLG